MGPRPELRTARLLLRGWHPEDEAPIAAINRDPEVTRWLNRPGGDGVIAGFSAAVTEHWDTHGFGLYAVELLDGRAAGEFVGFVGVAYPTFLPQLAHRPELGWRLAREAWGRGVATEAAAAVRDDAVARLSLSSLISIIHPENMRSRRVARKLGMSIESQIYNPVVEREVDIWKL